MVGGPFDCDGVADTDCVNVPSLLRDHVSVRPKVSESDALELMDSLPEGKDDSVALRLSIPVAEIEFEFVVDPEVDSEADCVGLEEFAVRERNGADCVTVFDSVMEWLPLIVVEPDKLSEIEKDNESLKETVCV